MFWARTWRRMTSSLLCAWMYEYFIVSGTRRFLQSLVNRPHIQTHTHTHTHTHTDTHTHTHRVTCLVRCPYAGDYGVSPASLRTICVCVCVCVGVCEVMCVCVC